MTAKMKSAASRKRGLSGPAAAQSDKAIGPFILGLGNDSRNRGTASGHPPAADKGAAAIGKAAPGKEYADPARRSNPGPGRENQRGMSPFQHAYGRKFTPAHPAREFAKQWIGPMKKMTAAPTEQTDVIKKVLDASPETLAKIDRILNGEDQPQAPRPSGPLLLGMSAAARHLGVSRVTLWRMIKDGTLGRVEIRLGSYRVRRADLEAIADGGCQSIRDAAC